MSNKNKGILAIGTIFMLLCTSITMANSNMQAKLYHQNDCTFKYVFDEPLLDQYQNETEANATFFFGVFPPDDDILLAQSFKPTYPILSKIEILLDKKINSNPIEVSVKESLDSSQSLITVEINNPNISNYPTWTTVNIPDINVTPENTYYIISSTIASAILIYEWHYGKLNGQPIDNYNRGMAYIYEYGTWTTISETDLCFKTYGKLGNISPVANFSFTPENPKNGEIITFNASASYDPDGEIIFYKWDWDNDEIFDEIYSTPFATHSWFESDSYQVKLQVIDDTNLISNITKNVNVYDIIVPDDYPTIQGAVDHSDHGYWIYVRPGGTYRENVVIDIERLHLFGGNKLNTTIDGQGNGHVIDILEKSHYVEISGFTLKNSGMGYAGINVQSSYNIINDDNIIDNGFGVHIRYSSGDQIFTNNFESNVDAISINNESFASFISNNTITQNQRYGIYIDNLSNGHVIQKNIISENIYGIKINGVSKTTVVRENIIYNNDIGIDCIFFSDGNRFFYNTFKDNNLNAYDASIDRWDNNAIGNYWDDYKGVDENGDGIGDTPYPIPGGDNKDRYPLIGPWGPPSIPLSPTGQIKGKPRKDYVYSTISTDPNGDLIKYGWDWNGDKNVDEWTTYYSSGVTVSITHTFTRGEYQVRVIAKDKNNQASTWSDPLNISISRSLTKVAPLFNKIVKCRNLILISRFEKLLEGITQYTYKNHYKLEKRQPLMTYADRSTIYVPRDYPSIQEAINNSNDYDTIIVKPGTYHEHLIVDKKITIIGEKRNQTIIEGDNAERHIIEIISDKVQIQNFTIQNCKISHSGIRIWTNNNTISFNTILNCGGGVEMYWTIGNIVKNNLFINNTFAVFFSDSTDCIGADNAINNNQYGVQVGLTLYGFEKTKIQLERNIIDKNIEYGILLLHADEMIIGNNTIKNHNLIGIGIFSGRNIRIFGNHFIRNAKGVTLHESQHTTFSLGNILDDNSPFLFYSTTFLISNNMGICILYKSDNNLLNHNTFNTWCNVYDMCKNIYDMDSKGNYWGDYTGVDQNGDGIGDTPYQIPGGNNIDRYPLMKPEYS